MKKTILLNSLTLFAILSSSTAFACGGQGMAYDTISKSLYWADVIVKNKLSVSHNADKIEAVLWKQINPTMGMEGDCGATEVKAFGTAFFSQQEKTCEASIDYRRAHSRLYETGVETSIEVTNVFCY